MSRQAQSVRIEGPDARAFAHAQFSSNVNSLEVGHWQFSAWLGAQGRVRCFFHLLNLGEESLTLLLRGGDATSMADDLRRFVFRSKVSIEALPTGALSTGPALPLHACRVEENVLMIGCGDHSMLISATASENGQWPRLQLHMGWPWLPSSMLGELLPATLSLQRLSAVVVDKGCYPGQEIVARLHFRGGHKRHLHSGRLSQPLQPGQTLRIGGEDSGRVLDVARISDVTEAQLILNDSVAADIVQGVQIVFDDEVRVQLVESWPV